MLCIPKSNHKKLVSDCYPAPKALAAAAPEYRPNGNECSRLCYYVQNKPAKLTKVGHLLAIRSGVEARAVHAGANDRARASLLITMGILAELVKSAGQRTPYFATSTETVLTNALQAATRIGGDTEISARAATTFAAYVHAIQPGVIELDANVRSSVCGVLSKLQAYATPRGDAAPRVDERARLVALVGAEGVVRSPSMFSSAFPEIVAHVAPVLLDALSPAHTSPEMLSRLSACNPVDAPLAEMPRPDADAAPSQEQAVLASMTLLRHIVQNTNAVQEHMFMREVFAWLDRVPSRWEERAWVAWLFTTVTQWTSRSAQYVVPNAMVEELRTAPRQNAAAKAAGVREPALLDALHAILASKADMFGLDFTDLIDTHLHALLTELQQNAPLQSVGPIIQTIGLLGARARAADQAVEAVERVQRHLVALHAGDGGFGKQPAAQRATCIRALLYALLAMCRQVEAVDDEVLPDVTPTVPLSTWQPALVLLSSPDPAVRYTFLVVFAQFMQHELTPQPVAARGSMTGAVLDDATRFMHAFTASVFVLAGHELEQEAAAAAPGLATCPSDYAGILACLDALYTRVPATSLLATVPALLALDQSATAAGAGGDAVPSGAPRRAARFLVGEALARLGHVWRVPSLEQYARQHILAYVGEAQVLAPALAPEFGPAPALPEFLPEPVAKSGPPLPSIQDIAGMLASSKQLQVAASADEASLHTWLLRTWSVASAEQDAQVAARPASGEGARPTGTARSASILRSSRTPGSPAHDSSVNVDQLRSVLRARGAAGAAPGIPAAGAAESGDVSLQDAHSLRTTRSRRHTRGHGQLGTRTSLSSLLDRYHVGGAESAPRPRQLFQQELAGQAPAPGTGAAVPVSMPKGADGAGVAPRAGSAAGAAVVPGAESSAAVRASPAVRDSVAGVSTEPTTELTSDAPLSELTSDPPVSAAGTAHTDKVDTAVPKWGLSGLAPVAKS